MNAYGRVRLLLVDGDDLREMWDALADRELILAADVGDFSFERVRQLRERIGDLLADAFAPDFGLGSAGSA